MRKICRTLNIFLGVYFAFTVAVYAAEARNYLDELRFAELQLSAVTTDMYLYLGWAADEKEAMKEASLSAISDLGQLKGYVMEQDFSEETAPLKDLTLKMIGQLTTIYQGIENKDETAIKKELVLFNGFYEEYAEGFKKLWQKLADGDGTEKELISFEEESRWIESEEVKYRYREAVGQIQAKNYAAAYETLKGMSEVIQDGPAAHVIALRLSDVLLVMRDDSADTKELDLAEKGLELLTQIVESNRYSPVLYEAFYKWRTTEQQLHHGMSNMSAIPNKIYNDRRWQLIQAIKRHLSENPDDAWARTQLALLWDLPNIQRGGPFGNDNLIHWGLLYGQIGETDSI